MIQPSDDWYRPDIPRKELKELMRRDNVKGLVDFGFGDCVWLPAATRRTC